MTNVNIGLNFCFHIHNSTLCPFDFRRKRAIQRQFKRVRQRLLLVIVKSLRRAN